MGLSKWGRAAALAAAAAFVLTGSPATAVGTTGAITDPSGVDYDAACMVNTDRPTPGPNAIGSPGTSYCADGSGVSIYDNSTEATDIRSVSLASDSLGRFVATCELDQIVPAGSTVQPATGGADTPAQGVFSGAGCKVMFQNPTRQNNTPTNAVGGGCPRVGGGQVFDQHGHWLDGFHFFIGFNQNWDGTKWVHSVQIGEYNPAPDGGFVFFEIGLNTGAGWFGGTAATILGTTVTITVGPIVLSSDASCAGGVFRTVFARPGDGIVNVKGLSTADVTQTLPLTVPGLVPGLDDLTSVGGYSFFSDVTVGNSWNGGIAGSVLQSNITGVSYTTGALERNRGGATATGQPGQASIDGRTQCCDPFDTLGESPACPYPTYGGTLPNNPSFNPAVGCHYDDDNVPTPNMGNPGGPWTAINPGERGTFLPEFWDTNFAFTF